MAILIAITGGIGSGKSMICRCLEAMGFKVYDCDSRAKALMDSDSAMIHRISGEISPETVKDGAIDRKALAGIVFADPGRLAVLNAIVHGAVLADIRRWRHKYTQEPLLFVETAILLESNLHLEVDEVWLVTAGESTRLARACRRDQASPEEIKARMQRQLPVEKTHLDIPLRIIDNDGRKAVLPQIQQLLSLHGADNPAALWKS